MGHFFPGKKNKKWKEVKGEIRNKVLNLGAIPSSLVDEKRE